jgi:hypothetical protein
MTQNPDLTSHCKPKVPEAELWPKSDRANC